MIPLLNEGLNGRAMKYLYVEFEIVEGLVRQHGSVTGTATAALIPGLQFESAGALEWPDGFNFIYNSLGIRFDKRFT
jgi:hypothetical protein